MKIAIVGAGIIGVTTAYELAADGHEVTVFERRGAAAEETSFANAGVVAPGYVTPWAAPGMPAKVLRYLFSRHAPVKLQWPLSARDLAWMARWLGACNPSTYLANRARMQRLAFYSRGRLHQLTEQLGLDYERSPGYTVLLRSAKDQQLVQPGLQVLREAGTRFLELDNAATRAIEPALSRDTDFAGAIHLPDDGVGNCRQFALLLRRQAELLGAQFRFNATVAHVTPGMRPQLVLAGMPAPEVFDAVVLCAGVASAALLRPLGLKLPMTAVYGYSVSAPVRESTHAPCASVVDVAQQISITRLGQRVRIAGGAELAGANAEHHTATLQRLYRTLNDWFPGGAQLSSGLQIWRGARTMLPDGAPMLGASGVPGLWLNTGHGANGWALACASARAVADLIAQREPEVNLDGLGMRRF